MRFFAMLQLSDFRSKKVLVMGLGLHGGGIGTAAFFARLGARVVVTDLKSKRELAPSLEKLKRFKNISYHLGGHRAADFQNTNYVIQGPGVPGKSKFLAIARRAGVPILSDVEVFFLACPARIIGITGTKGKSTAATLIGAFLHRGLERSPSRRAGGRVWVGGNIRKSMLDFLPRVRKGDLVVLELSSFQLDLLARQRRSPEVAVITNIFPDHLNRYPSMAAYEKSKTNIFRFQRKRSLLFVAAEDARLLRLVRGATGRVIRVRTAVVLRPFRRAIPESTPPYYFPNLAAAVAVARHFGVGETAIRAVLKKFRGISGRMEFVRAVRGIEFINDTTATNPGAAEAAVRATKRRLGQDRKLHMIAGGFDKGLPVRDFVRALAECAASVVFLPGAASGKMELGIRRQALGIRKRQTENGELKVFHARSMREAVGVAYRNARSGDVVLLSPGAASFGLFQHEFDRGDQFAAAVRRLR